MKTKEQLLKEKQKMQEELEQIDNNLKSIDDLPVIEINTGNTGSATVEIPIDGHLDCMIFDVENKVDVVVESELGYLIFKRNEIIGCHYIAPRIRITPQVDNARDYLTFDKFNLDEKIILTVLGPKNSTIKLIVRLDK